MLHGHVGLPLARSSDEVSQWAAAAANVPTSRCQRAIPQNVRKLFLESSDPLVSAENHGLSESWVPRPVTSDRSCLCVRHSLEVKMLGFPVVGLRSSTNYRTACSAYVRTRRTGTSHLEARAGPTVSSYLPRL